MFDELKRYVRFGAAEEQALSELGPRLAPALPEIVREFYARIAEHSAAAAVISGGPEQVERLQESLLGWLRALFEGPYDRAYFERRAAIGRRHVLVQLPLHYAFGAMDVIRNALTLRVTELERELCAPRLSALNSLLDLELAIIVHSYHEDLLGQLKVRERLAGFGQIASAIGHELRTPLAVVESSAHLLRQGLGDDPDALRHLERISAQVARSTRIIAGLLDIVRERPPTQRAVSARALADGAVDSVRDAHAFSVTLVVAGEPVGELFVDPEQIGLALHNLLTNAIEAAGPDGNVRLDLGRQGAEIEYLVSDSGPGVQPAIRARIFEPLFTTKQNGVGLGLSLCRKLVEAHGGMLELVPPRHLAGAAFSLRLAAADATS